MAKQYCPKCSSQLLFARSDSSNIANLTVQFPCTRCGHTLVKTYLQIQQEDSKTNEKAKQIREFRNASFDELRSFIRLNATIEISNIRKVKIVIP